MSTLQDDWRRLGQAWWGVVMALHGPVLYWPRRLREWWVAR